MHINDKVLGNMTPFALARFEELKVNSPELSTPPMIEFNGRDLRSRPFNLLRTRLKKELDKSQSRIVGVTSATPGAGKSFLSTNLAASLERVSDEPVYLVDLDLRRASLTRNFGIETDAGNASHLEGSIEDLEVLGRRLDQTNLVVFPTGKVTNNSAELVSGKRFSSFIQQLRARTKNSTVIIDLPPAFANDDAMLIMRELDGYILVAESGVSTKRQIREVLRLLGASTLLWHDPESVSRRLRR